MNCTHLPRSFRIRTSHSSSGHPPGWHPGLPGPPFAQGEVESVFARIGEVQQVPGCLEMKDFGPPDAIEALMIDGSVVRWPLENRILRIC